jgi:hypothetical protein
MFGTNAEELIPGLRRWCNGEGNIEVNLPHVEFARIMPRGKGHNPWILVIIFNNEMSIFFTICKIFGKNPAPVASKKQLRASLLN